MPHAFIECQIHHRSNIDSFQAHDLPPTHISKAGDSRFHKTLSSSKGVDEELLVNTHEFSNEGCTQANMGKSLTDQKRGKNYT